MDGGVCVCVCVCVVCVDGGEECVWMVGSVCVCGWWGGVCVDGGECVWCVWMVGTVPTDAAAKHSHDYYTCSHPLVGVVIGTN